MKSISTRKLRSEITKFPQAIDDAVNKKFPGVDCKTRFDFFGDMSYVSTFESKSVKKTAEINAYIQGFMDGNLELQERIDSVIS